ncbi:MAG: N,N-dimethylformamidase beta subunit family domain-containing protein [Planctomycetota bacterium]
MNGTKTQRQRAVRWLLVRYVLAFLVIAANRANATINFTQWGTVTPATGWSFEAGDFTGDGRTDVVGYHQDGSVWVGSNTDFASFTFTLWATLIPASGWTIKSGEFTGDGLMDVLAYHSSDGSVWVGTNSGSSTFVWSQWASVSPPSGWSFWTGDFTADGRTDVGAYHNDGSVWVGRNNLSNQFIWQLFATVSPPSGWSFGPGDFTRDGVVDVFAYHPTDGSLFVGANTLTSFVWSQWFTLDPVAGWSIIPGGFSGAGTADVAAYYSGNGEIFVGRNAVSTFYFTEKAAQVAPASGWQFAPGTNFTSDNLPDLFAYHPIDGSVWVGRNQGEKPEGYAWPLSAAPGETISFMTSGAALPTVRLYRHRSTGASVSSTLIATLTHTSVGKPLNEKPWRNGAGWSTSFTHTIPAGWPSGIYSAALRPAMGGPDYHITFIVKPARTAQSKVAVLASVNTWLAYNSWGGKGKYDGAALTSFLRPAPDTSPVAEGGGPHHQTRAELWILTWLEDQGYEPHVYTDIDFHNGFHNGRPPYEMLVFGTHPEYWSSRAYDKLENFLAGGGKVLYLGGNGLFERGVYSSDRTQMTFLNGVEDGPREPSLFRNLAPPRHEREILGISTQRCSAPGMPFEVLEPGHFVFAGTGLGLFQTFGATGFNTNGGSLSGGASGHEIDTRVDSPGTDCSFSAGPTTPPAGLVWLARGLPSGGPGADMTYYDHPGGGFVFSAGSITFGGSIPADVNIQRILRNVLEH